MFPFPRVCSFIPLDRVLSVPLLSVALDVDTSSEEGEPVSAGTNVYSDSGISELGSQVSFCESESVYLKHRRC